MAKRRVTVVRGCVIPLGIVLGIGVVIVGAVGVRTWIPLQHAEGALGELNRNLGSAVDYAPPASGTIPADRMEVFLAVRRALEPVCGDYGSVQRGFDAVESLDEREPGDLDGTGQVAVELGGASWNITPFLARFFERRNEALLAASMSLQEYAYIYAVAYREQLLLASTRAQIFANGKALSPEASRMLRACLERRVAGAPDGDWTAELRRMADDPGRLVWQDGQPEPLRAGLARFRAALDSTFCAATAGLEMERTADRAIGIALY